MLMLLMLTKRTIYIYDMCFIYLLIFFIFHLIYICKRIECEMSTQLRLFGGLCIRFEGIDKNMCIVIIFFDYIKDSFVVNYIYNYYKKLLNV